ncbi:MAG: 30S ribosomal protein S4 [Anaerolineae bacterium]|nr:30S ribosomal protein S4 [Anaerolineae bacterium]MDW8070759.1 30S ribosomal protein S4 [Anaerolineae bacterium]
MARYLKPVCKLCRREGEKLFLKGERCFSPKCSFERRSYPAGMHGKQAQFRRKESDYALQLRAKQKARRVYGVLERQFRRYFEHAQRQPGLTGVNLLIMLERRLDNVVYRLGFADSRAQARQLVRHGHFTVNDAKVDIPSYLVNVGDKIAVRESSRRTTYFKELAQRLDGTRTPGWLSLDAANLTGTVVSAPSRDDIDVTLNEQLIVEYYSR